MRDMKQFRKKMVLFLSAISLFMGTNGTIWSWASDKTVEQTGLGEPKYVYWESDTVGRWSSVSRAQEYQVKLYVADNIDRDEENRRTIDFNNEDLEAVMTKRTTELSCDFSEYMKDSYSYFFVVRATPKRSELAYVTNGSWVASPDVDFKGRQVLGITDGKWRNYLEGSKYEDGGGNFLSGGWHLIQGCWYLFDENGYSKSGWQIVDRVRYFLKEDGKLATGWFRWNDNWYYADKEGKLQTGWVMMQPGEYYYFGADGVMARDMTIDGYPIDSDGKSQYRGK